MDVSAFIHATEDPEKVVAACRRVLPAAYADATLFERQHLLGHYRNPITLLRTQITQRPAVMALLDHLADALSEGDKTQLAVDVARRLDDRGALYLRLDKQDAFRSQLTLGHRDSIRLTLKLTRSRKRVEDAVAVYRALGLLGSGRGDMFHDPTAEKTVHRV